MDIYRRIEFITIGVSAKTIEQMTNILIKWLHLAESNKSLSLSCFSPTHSTQIKYTQTTKT